MRITDADIPRDPGPAAWNSILGAAPTYPVLDMDQSVDIAVIGAGFAGLSAARRLLDRDPSLKIAVLEARKIADGPAGRNSGFMIDLPHELNSESYAGSHEGDLRQIRLNRSAIDFAEKFATQNGLSDLEFSREGKISASATAAGEHHLTDYAKHLDALGEPHRILSAGELRDMTGGDFYTLGLETKGAAMIQPASYIRKLAASVASGGDLYENSPVTSMDKTGDGWHLGTPKASIKAAKVIMAVNGHAQAFGYFKKKLMHIFTYASMTRNLTPKEMSHLGGHRNWGLLPADPMGTTVRRVGGDVMGGDRVVVRNHFSYDPTLIVDEARLVKIAKKHDKSFKQRFPSIANVDMEYRWGGRLCLTWNSVPAFGMLDDNLYSAICQNGVGTVKGTCSGMLAADLALDIENPLLDDIAAYDAPQTIPMEPLAHIGANMVLKWKEWRAGVEF